MESKMQILSGLSVSRGKEHFLRALALVSLRSFPRAVVRMECAPVRPSGNVRIGLSQGAGTAPVPTAEQPRTLVTAIVCVAGREIARVKLLPIGDALNVWVDAEPEGHVAVMAAHRMAAEASDDAIEAAALERQLAETEYVFRESTRKDGTVTSAVISPEIAQLVA